VATDVERMPARRDDAAPSPSVVVALLPIMTVVLVAFLIIGMAMPVLPLRRRRQRGRLFASAGFRRTMIEMIHELESGPSRTKTTSTDR
jgi:Flp pilus assembly protein TadB